MTDRQIAATAGLTPQAILLSTYQQLVPKLAFASYDGTGATGPFLPVVKFIGPDGSVAGQAVCDEMAAGASVDQTWFRGLSKNAPITVVPTKTGIYYNNSVTVPAHSGVSVPLAFLAGDAVLDVSATPVNRVLKNGNYTITAVAVPASNFGNPLGRLNVKVSLFNSVFGFSQENQQNTVMDYGINGNGVTTPLVGPSRFHNALFVDVGSTAAIDTYWIVTVAVRVDP